MWVVQVQKDLVDLSKHYIHEIDALVSRDRAECFALEKNKNTQKQFHSSSKIVSLRRQRFRGIQMYTNFVSRDLCTRCGPVCLRTLTHSYMPDDIVGREHYSTLPTIKCQSQSQTFLPIFTQKRTCVRRTPLLIGSVSTDVLRREWRPEGECTRFWHTLTSTNQFESPCFSILY